MNRLLKFSVEISELSNGLFLCVINYNGVMFEDTAKNARAAYRRALAQTTLKSDLMGD